MTIQQAHKARADKHLDALVRYEGEVMARAAMIDKLLADGWKPIICNKPNRNKIEKDRQRLKQISSRWILGLPNENIPEVKQGLLLREKLKDGSNYNEPNYYMIGGEFTVSITKTQYDYATRSL